MIEETTEQSWTRIMAKVEVDGAGCWLWTAYKDVHGYGRIYWKGDPQLAHRITYQLTNGPIPKGQEIDHLCRVRRCVNPSHLDAVTLRENCYRGNSFAGINARKTHCKRGHEFTEENTYRWRRARICRACRKGQSA